MRRHNTQDTRMESTRGTRLDTTRAGWLGVTAFVASICLGGGAFAQGSNTDPASQFERFLCEIDLADDDVLGPNWADFFIGAPPSTYEDGKVPTFDTKKLCTGSATQENIKLDCIAQIQGWDPANGNLSFQDINCAIGGAACGIVDPTDGDTILTATLNNTLSISSNGTATLSCQYKGP
jgi:hypothetical protein